MVSQNPCLSNRCCHPEACSRKPAMWFKKAFQDVSDIPFIPPTTRSKVLRWFRPAELIDEWETCCSVISCILLDRKQLSKIASDSGWWKKERTVTVTFSPIWVCWAERVSTFSAALSNSYLNNIYLYMGPIDLLFTVASICWLQTWTTGFRLTFHDVWVGELFWNELSS